MKRCFEGKIALRYWINYSYKIDTSINLNHIKTKLEKVQYCLNWKINFLYDSSFDVCLLSKYVCYEICNLFQNWLKIDTLASFWTLQNSISFCLISVFCLYSSINVNFTGLEKISFFASISQIFNYDFWITVVAITFLISHSIVIVNNNLFTKLPWLWKN